MNLIALWGILFLLYIGFVHGYALLRHQFASTPVPSWRSSFLPHHETSNVWNVNVQRSPRQLQQRQKQPQLSPQRRKNEMVLHLSKGEMYEDMEKEDNHSSYSVIIGKGSSLNLEGAGTLTFSHTLRVDGFLRADLECTRSSSTIHEDGQEPMEEEEFELTGVVIGPDGELHADISSVDYVQVFGKLIGSVVCDRLIMGPNGELAGDVLTKFM